MTGPEHYREAEKSLDLAASVHPASVERNMALATAQVHATLALAAASAMGIDKSGTKDVWDEWVAAFGGAP